MNEKELYASIKKNLRRLFVSSAIYGLVFINWIDLYTTGPAYHLWLILMYFLPFMFIFYSKKILSIFDLEIVIALGLHTSLMNDIFWGIPNAFIRYPEDPLGYLARYYSLWLIPQPTFLGWYADIGFVKIPVYSWTMALTIYLRIIVVALLHFHIKTKLKEITEA